MKNNLKVIIKIFSTFYLPRVVLFPPIPLEVIPTFLLVTVGIMSLGSKKIEILSLKRKKRVNFQSPFINDYYTFKNSYLILFYFIFLYSSKVLYSLIVSGNGNIIHVDIIFAAPKFGFSEHHISANNALYLKTSPPLEFYY